MRGNRGRVKHDKAAYGQARSHPNARRRRREEWEHAEQVQKQDVNEKRPQERHVVIGVVFADVRPSHVIANECEKRFESVPERPFWQRPFGSLAAKRHENRDREQGGNQLQHHELGDLKLIAK
jgi:hypothetical protein